MENDDASSNPFASIDGDPDLSLDLELDLDLDLELDKQPVSAPGRPTKFQPKLKGKLLPKTEPSSEFVADLVVPTPDLSAVKKREDGPSMAKAEEMDGEGERFRGAAVSYEEEEEEKLNGDAVAMEVDGVGEEEDIVVREIDVFFNPSRLDEDTELYVMQYPLRPCWRPYELNERCQEVKLKPKESKIEFNMVVDVDSENYDNEVDDRLRLRQQVLSSLKMPCVTGYTVGVLIGNQLHLNPIHAVMQLRPSMAHIGAYGLNKKKHSAGIVNPGEEKGEAFAKQTASQGKEIAEATNEDNGDEKEWVSLEYHPMDSPISNGYQMKMLSKEENPIAFLMSPHDYLSCLCPGTSADNKNHRGPCRRALLSMPLDERLKKLFLEGPQLHRFDTLLHLAPSESVDDVLKVIQQYAVLVQGLWVSRSSLLHSGPQKIVRDYILFLFTKNNTITNNKLKEIKIPMEGLKRILSPLAFERTICNDWKFKEPTDSTFLKCYPEVAKMQENLWSHRREHTANALQGLVRNPLTGVKGSAKSGSSVKPTSTSSLLQNPKRGNEVLNPGPSTLSDEILEALPKALTELFRNQKVCSMNRIRQGLREMAVSKSTLPKADPRIFVLAAHGASATASELEPIICKVAEKIHDVYVPKSSSNPTLNPLRNVVISLLRGKPRTEKLKKGDVVAAVEMVLGKTFSASDYNQILNELCVSNRGAGWLLKSGDEMPN